MQGEGGEWGGSDPEVDDWSDHQWDAMERAAAAASAQAFSEIPAEPPGPTFGLTNAQHLKHRRGLKEAFREDPWHTVKELLTAKGTLAAVGGVAAAAVFVVVAIAAFSGGPDSDDVTLNGDDRGDKTRDFDLDGDKPDGDTTSSSTEGATTTASSTTTSTGSTTTTTEPDDEDDDGDDDNGPVVPPPTDPATTSPPPATTTTRPPATTPPTTARPVVQPVIDSFGVELDSGCGNGTVEASFSWTSRNGTAATIVTTAAPNQPVTVPLVGDGLQACPRPGDRWTLRVTGAAGSTPATRTITVPSLPVD